MRDEQFSALVDAICGIDSSNRVSAKSAQQLVAETSRAHTYSEQLNIQTRNSNIRSLVWSKFEDVARFNPSQLSTGKIGAYVDAIFANQIDWQLRAEITRDIFIGLRKVYPLPKKPKASLPNNEVEK